MRTRTLWNEEHTEHVHRTECGSYVVRENWLFKLDEDEDFINNI